MTLTVQEQQAIITLSASVRQFPRATSEDELSLYYAVEAIVISHMKEISQRCEKREEH